MIQNQPGPDVTVVMDIIHNQYVLIVQDSRVLLFGLSMVFSVAQNQYGLR